MHSRRTAQTAADAAFDLKSGTFTLIVLHLQSADASRVRQQLEERLAKTPGFFSNDAVVLDLQAIEASDLIPDFAAITGCMRAHGLMPAGVRAGSPAQQEAAVAAGLGILPAPLMPSKASAAVREEPSAPSPAAPEPQPVPEPPPPAPPEPAQAAPALPVRRTRIIDKPVRTGQQIYAQDADLVLLAIVNAGAEIIADGNIHVYAPLRGRALAGVKGDTQARIFAASLEAELVSIAGCYRVMEEQLPAELRNRPVQVRLEQEKLKITAL